MDTIKVEQKVNRRTRTQNVAEKKLFNKKL